jgi:DNA polymerase III epsilon subunit family exonuclease
METLLTFIMISAAGWMIYDYFKNKITSSKFNISILPERFVVLDLETTGLNPERNKIIEIGAIRVNRDSINHETFQSFVKIKGKVPGKITEITGITSEMLNTEGEPIEIVLPKFMEFIGDLRLVTFNAPFDMGFLKEAAKAQGLSIDNYWSCALDMARRAWPGRKSYKLSSLAKDGGLATQNHRALGDCQLALTVYTAAVKKLRSIS